MYHSIMLEYNYRYSGLSRQVREINVYCQIFSTQPIVLLDMEGTGVCGDILELFLCWLHSWKTAKIHQVLRYRIRIYSK